LIWRKNQLVGHRRRNTICLVLDTIGALTRRCLSTIAHVDPAVAMLPIGNRAREGDRSWQILLQKSAIRGAMADSIPESMDECLQTFSRS
jgi:hypothetical protein